MFVTNEMFAVDEAGNIEGGDKSIEKVRKLLKTRKLSKGLKLSKSENSKDEKSAKFKKLSKTENSPNFDAKEAGPSFLTPKARVAFNRLQLAFTKAPIFWHFDPEYYIRIKTDALGYTISGVLNQLAFKTRPDRIVTKTNLGQWHLVLFFSRKMILAEI